MFHSLTPVYMHKQFVDLPAQSPINYIWSIMKKISLFVSSTLLIAAVITAYQLPVHGQSPESVARNIAEPTALAGSKKRHH